MANAVASSSASASGIGLFGLLGVVFIVLKILGYINWSWWLVLLPLYGPTALVLALFLIGGIIGLIYVLLNNKR
jgi:hypothetical protein